MRFSPENSLAMRRQFGEAPEVDVHFRVYGFRVRRNPRGKSSATTPIIKSATTEAWPAP